MTFAASNLDAQVVKAMLSGMNLVLNDPSCRALDAQLVCTFGTVPAGRMYGLPSRRVLVAQASFERPSGVSYSLVSEGVVPPKVTGESHSTPPVRK